MRVSCQLINDGYQSFKISKNDILTRWTLIAMSDWSVPAEVAVSLQLANPTDQILGGCGGWVGRFINQH